MSECQNGKYLFTVKEGEGDFWIALESREDEPAHLKGWTLGFDLPGVAYADIERAKEIALYLDENLGDLVLIPPGPPRHEESSSALAALGRFWLRIFPPQRGLSH